ncbi:MULTISPECIES: ATP-dependent DNA ligase [Microbacterium]|uniref:ATP-dependent DNA ligase n=1 Tax=Microbacterium wangchenii TaxID=2541726 RepID=A0ABX5SPX4_9MICO|nr:MULTISPECIES: ATP-dependent DNA ligase [Microbacterium]MCK6066895.1 ATP-dependent DNA ligase [Microbacterium sp. EYE_512]QBR88200.1 ATP-dependent DNA ligase [Microbacterium wangchenii]TFV83680.1 ATP-dependent DNA ligase [Microbacterium sp. dk485]TXK18010.1 ATP-dependent DNA ligase [Microbacterium wangchenii]
MGKLLFEQQLRVDFEDRLLAHLQVVITAKLRRGESFVFSWRDDPSVGDGRTSIWVHPRSVIVYKYHGSRRPALNRAWLDALSYTANSPEGLYVVPEPPPPRAETGSQDEAD